MTIRFRIGNSFLLVVRFPTLNSIQRLLALGVLVATIINLLVVFLLGQALQSAPEKVELTPEEKMIVLNLLEDKEIEKARELLENPKANDLRPDNSKIISDRNSRTDITEPPKESAVTNNLDVVREKPVDAEVSKETDVTDSKIEPGRNTVEVQPFPFLKKKSVMQGVTGQTDDPGQSMDGVSYNLNTYQWEYAPYMLKWKNKMINKWYELTSRINFNPFSPVGTMQIWVKMDRRGNLVDSKIVSYNCDKSFVAPAYASVVNSFPLDPLPDGFPEELLETTWTITIYNR